MYTSYLPDGRRFGTACFNYVVSVFNFFFQRHLLFQSRHDLFARDFVARYAASDLCFQAARGYNYAVKEFVPAGFDQYRRLDYYDTVRVIALEIVKHPLFEPEYGWVNQAVQHLQFFSIYENNRRKLFSIDSAAECKNIGAELFENRAEGFSTWLEHRVSQPVCVDHVASEALQLGCNERFPGRVAARKAYLHHPGDLPFKCVSASRTVLAISMAIVSGPTPPGTGV